LYIVNVSFILFTMLNIDEFLFRLDKIMDNHQLNASAFAELIGVQRSSVSHILSKRNKPSLDFILKIYYAFEDVELKWLLFGEKDLIEAPLLNHDLQNKEDVVDKDENYNVSENGTVHKITSNIIEIVQFYEDGSFRSFLPKT